MPGGKKGGKPDLAAMLAKVKKVNPTPAADGKPSASEVVAKPEEKQAESHQIAVPKPDNLPFPPPIPLDWPPKAYIAPEKKKTSEPVAPLKIEVPSEEVKTEKKEKKVKTKQIVVHEPPKELPEGYYLAATKAGMVAPYEILQVGFTTQASINELREQFEEEDRDLSELDEGDEDYFESNSPESLEFRLSFQKEYADELIANRLSANDLPVPSNFMSAIKRLKRANEIREEKRKFEKDLEFRNYDIIPSTLSTSISGSPKKVRPTVPEEFQFRTQRHFDTKRRTFRKDSGRSEVDQLPLSNRVEEKVVHQSIHRYGRIDRPTAYWLQSLRSDGDPRFNENQGANSSSIGKNRAAGGGLQNIPTETVVGGFSQRPQEEYNISQEYYRKVLKGTATTEVNEPRFHSTQTLQRRQQEREIKKQHEDISQQFQKELNRSKKEILKEKALGRAKEIGVYKPHNRFRLHQRMIERYQNKPEIIGGLNLEKVTQQAFEQYYVSSGVTSHASDMSNYSDLPWENLHDDPMYYQGENAAGYQRNQYSRPLQHGKNIAHNQNLNMNNQNWYGSNPPLMSPNHYGRSYNQEMNLDELLEEYS